MKRFLVRSIATVVAIVALAVAALVVVLSREHDEDVTLPAPTGPFAVGRVTDFWRDDGAPEPFAADARTPRQLAVWIWYPAAASPDAARAEYLPGDWQAAFARERRGLLARLLTQLLARDPSHVHVHGFTRAPISPARPSYPVVILRGGLGAQVTDYTTLAEDLASHGYVIVGFDAAYRTSLVVLPDGRTIARPPAANPETVTGDAKVRLAVRLLEAWTADVRAAVDRLERLNEEAGSMFGGRLDVHSLAVVGHSLGGATALEFCHDDARCRAAVDIDGLPLGRVVKEGVRQPVMFLLSDHAGEDEAESRRVIDDMQWIYGRADAPAWLTIRGANHFSFSDQVVVRPEALIRGLRVARIIGVEPRRGLAIAADCVRRFLDVHLKGAPTAELAALTRTYPELQSGAAAAGRSGAR